MKKIILALLFSAAALGAGAQQYDWDQLDSLLARMRYAKADSLARQHYRQATQANDGTSMLIAAFYLTNVDYALKNHERDSAKARFDLLVRKLKGPDLAVAQAFRLQAYDAIYRENYWSYRRNKISDDPGLSPGKWHFERMMDTLTACVDGILGQAELLRRTDPSPYSHLLPQKPESSPLDNTLLGTLAETLLDNTYDIVDCAVDTRMPLTAFAALDDSLARQLSYHLRLHLALARIYADSNADIRLWLDLKRLESLGSDSSDIQALDSLIGYYTPLSPDTSLLSTLELLRAKRLYKFDRKAEAMECCNRIEQRYPNTAAAAVAAKLRYNIQLPYLFISYQRSASSEQSRMAYIDAANMRAINFRLVAWSPLPDTMTQKQKLDTLLKMEPLKSWQQLLPDSGDYKQHKYLIALPPMPQGNYYLMAYGDSLFYYDLMYQSADATFITFDNIRAPKRLSNLTPASGFVINRIDGTPVAGERVTLHRQSTFSEDKYRHDSRRTDRKGYFHFPISSLRYLISDDYDYSIALNDTDRCFLSGKFDEEGYSPNVLQNDYYNEYSDGKRLLIAMVDRPVHRLGDTVQFCCEAYRSNHRGKAWNIHMQPARRQKLTATFSIEYDNDVPLDTLELTTDEYGRCWGSFVIPADGKNGNYEIEVWDGKTRRGGFYDTRTIRVEAYNPPHFEAELSTTPPDSSEVQGTLRRFGEPMTVYGKAESYSGAPMGGAKVRWKVYGQMKDNPFSWIRDASTFGKAVAIDSLTIGDDGTFSFTFTPQQPEKTQGKQGAIGVFTAVASVTDLDGEMHVAKSTFIVSDLPGYLMPVNDDLSQLRFAYNDFDHHPLKGAVHVTLQQLRQPDTLLVVDQMMERYPQARWLGSKEEFRRCFPGRAFSREEADPCQWPVVATRLDTVTEGRSIAPANLPSGLYRVLLSNADGSCTLDTLINYVAPQGRVTGNSLVHLHYPAASYRGTVECQVGDTVRLELGSAFGSQPLYYKVGCRAKTYEHGMMMLDSCGTTTLSIPVKKNMRQGFSIALAAYRDGLEYKTRIDVLIRHPEHFLKVSTTTFRNKLEPGQQERWQLHVSDADSNDVQAALSLTLYDRSLNQDYEGGVVLYSSPWFGGLYSWCSPDFAFNEWRTLNSDEYRLTFAKRTDDLTYTSLIGNSMHSPATYYKLLREIRYKDKVLHGIVYDSKTNETMPFANVMLNKDGHQLLGTQTDFDGLFTIGAIPPGRYQLKISCVGYTPLIYEFVVSQDSLCPFINAALTPGSLSLECVEIKTDRSVPVIEIGAAESGQHISADDIARMPGVARGEDGMVTALGGVGAVRKRTGVNPPKAAIAEIVVIPEEEPLANYEAADNGDKEKAIAMRKNMSTLAFFRPDLTTDKKGMATIDFTMPDALTQWQFSGVAWNKKMSVGFLDTVATTQRKVMAQPQLPRFLRQGDTADLRMKVSNLTDTTMPITATIKLARANGGANLATSFNHSSYAPHSSRMVACHLYVPQGIDKLLYTVTAQSNEHSDGEQGIIAVLPISQRVTTSQLLYLPGSLDGKPVSRSYATNLHELRLSDSLTLSYTANPAQLAIEALPHFKQHRMPGSIYNANELYVNYLTAILADSGSHQQKLLNKNQSGLKALLREQVYDGGWGWMPHSSKASRYTTETVLRRLAAFNPAKSDKTSINDYMRKAVKYLDRELVKDWKDTTRQLYLNDHFATLYTRSLYFDLVPLSKCDSITQMAYDYYYTLAKIRHGNDERPLCSRAEMALLLYRFGDTAAAIEQAKLLKERALIRDDKGMYWADNVSGWFRSQRPVETAALLVDLFADVLHDWESVNRIQQWILSAKKGTSWETDMSTAAAIGALLRTADTNHAAAELKAPVQLLVDGTPVELEDKKPLDLTADKPAQNIQLTSSSRLPSWGALFHSCERPIDSIPCSGTGITLRKTLSVVGQDGSLTLITPDTRLLPGMRLRVHIEITCDQDLEQLVLHEDRPACCEPASLKSGWRWGTDSDGNSLHYYSDVRNDRLDCYFERVNQGHYTIEYDLLVRHTGTYSTGIGTLQSVYAPEFRANTASSTLKVVE